MKTDELGISGEIDDSFYKDQLKISSDLRKELVIKKLRDFEGRYQAEFQKAGYEKKRELFDARNTSNQHISTSDFDEILRISSQENQSLD